MQSANNRFFVRYSMLRQRIYRDQILEGIVEQAGNQGEQYNLNHNVGVSWNRIFGRYVNEMRLGYTATNADFAQPTATGMKADEFGFKGLPESQLTTGGIPAISISNYSQVGIRNFRPQFQNPRAIQFLDTVSALVGRHSLKLGVEVRRKKDVELDDERVGTGLHLQRHLHRQRAGRLHARVGPILRSGDQDRRRLPAECVFRVLAG